MSNNNDILGLLGDSSDVKEKMIHLNDNVENIKSPDPEVLYFEIREDDDMLVVELKTKINSARLKMADINLSNTAKYSFVNNFKTRKTIKFSSIKTWADILNLDIHFELVPKKKF